VADLLPSRIEPMGDSPENPADSRRDRSPKLKAVVKPAPDPPPLDTENDESHQLDELA
jgi:hypothetical protein